MSAHPPIPPNCKYFVLLESTKDVWMFQVPWWDNDVSIGVDFAKNSDLAKDRGIVPIIAAFARCAWLDITERDVDADLVWEWWLLAVRWPTIFTTDALKRESALILFDLHFRAWREQKSQAWRVWGLVKGE